MDSHLLALRSLLTMPSPDRDILPSSSMASSEPMSAALARHLAALSGFLGTPSPLMYIDAILSPALGKPPSRAFV